MHTFETLILNELERQERYKLMTGAVIPRPIALVSTRNQNGSNNLAPYSFFNVVSVHPPLVTLSCACAQGAKDTQFNIEQTGEFVVGILPSSLWEKVDACSVELERGASEFEHAGLTPGHAAIVAADIILEARVNLECHVRDAVTLPGESFRLFVAEVVAAHLASGVRNDRGHIDAAAIDPLSRLGGRQYSGITAIRQGRPAGT